MQQIVRLLTPNTEELIDIPLKKSDEEIEVLVLFIGIEKEHFTVETITRHEKLRTQAYTEVRGVLFDESKAVVKGTIAIAKGAQQTQSFLTQKVLLTTPRTYAETVPQLEIEANDVKASHAATVGQISEEEIFYLMSRGYRREEAEKLIIEGFFQPVIDRIEDIELRSEVIEKIAYKFKNSGRMKHGEYLHYS